jgi:hypothetical protein
MRKRTLATALAAAALLATTITPAQATVAKPGQGMTHIKTVPGLSSTLEGVGVVLYAQGGATSAVIGDSLAAANGQVVIHVPITGATAGVAHIGSTLVFFNTANNKLVQLQNPVIDLANGVVTATIPQGTGAPVTVLTITNLTSVKSKVTTDRKTKIRTTAYTGAQLAIAPGVGPVLSSLPGLPAGTIPDGTAFATADLTLTKLVRKA